MPAALVGVASRRHPAHLHRMSKRARDRFAKPPYWSDAPAPRPAPPADVEELGPTRYGDWVRNGIAVDF